MSLSALREQVFARDEHLCRICFVTAPERSRYGFLELAHLKARGMGGNPDGSRNTSANTACICSDHHRGTRSLHSGHIGYEFLEPEKGADGAMAWTFFEKLPKAELGLNR